MSCAWGWTCAEPELQPGVKLLFLFQLGAESPLELTLSTHKLSLSRFLWTAWCCRVCILINISLLLPAATIHILSIKKFHLAKVIYAYLMEVFQSPEKSNLSVQASKTATRVKATYICAISSIKGATFISSILSLHLLLFNLQSRPFKNALLLAGFFFFFPWGKGTCETMLSTGDYTELLHVGA